MFIFRDLSSGRALRVNKKHEDVIQRLEKMGWTRQPDVPSDVNIATIETLDQLKRYDSGTTFAPAVAPPEETKPAPKADKKS
jgi:hypothetical protein